MVVHHYLNMRLESVLCFCVRNSARVGLALAPAARFAVATVLEAAERMTDLAATADIVLNFGSRVPTSSKGFCSFALWGSPKKKKYLLLF